MSRPRLSVSVPIPRRSSKKKKKKNEIMSRKLMASRMCVMQCLGCRIAGLLATCFVLVQCCGDIETARLGPGCFKKEAQPRRADAGPPV